jgi:hypothetical protein
MSVSVGWHPLDHLEISYRYQESRTVTSQELIRSTDNTEFPILSDSFKDPGLIMEAVALDDIGASSSARIGVDSLESKSRIHLHILSMLSTLRMLRLFKYSRLALSTMRRATGTFAGSLQ